MVEKSDDRTFSKSVLNPSDADEINFCFTDRRGNWQNNFGQNWNFKLK